MSRETGAAADLLHSSLHDILHEAVETRGESSVGVWSELFRGLYRGGWVVIDAPVGRSSVAGVQPRLVVEFPVSDGADNAALIADLAVLERYLGPAGKPRRVIFAAQLEDFLPQSGSDHEWRIVLDRDTAFLWTSAETLEMLGFPLDRATQKVLDDQARLEGLAP
jgi:hypothetical protein